MRTLSEYCTAKTIKGSNQVFHFLKNILMKTIHITKIDGTVIFTHQGENITHKDAVEAAYKAGVSFAKANLAGFNLTGANLEGADFRGAYLNNAYLRDANLRNANFTDAVLLRTFFSTADITGANFTNALKGLE